jgi:hypothetical protein
VLRAQYGGDMKGEDDPPAKSAHASGQGLAQAVRDACLRAALDGYEQAGRSGLCAEGRWEMAVDSIRSLDLALILEDIDRP